MIQREGNCDRERRTDIFFAFQPNRAAHELYHIFYDGKPQPGPGEAGRAFLPLLCERLKRMLLKLLAHAKPGVRAYKLIPGGFAIAGQLLAGKRGRALYPIVFYGIGRNVHQNPVQIQRAADQIPMVNDAVSRTAVQANAIFKSVCFDNGKMLFQQFY